jgi:hypothetical protein
MNRTLVALIVAAATLAVACEPAPEAGEGPIGVLLRPLASCDGASDTKLEGLDTLRFVVQVPEGADDLLTTVLDTDYSLDSGFTLSGIPVGERRELTVLGYSSSDTSGTPTMFGRARRIGIAKDQKTDVSIFLSSFGGYGCVNTPAELTRRVFPAVVPLDDGRILIAGGFTAASTEGTVSTLKGADSAAFIYDPGLNTFERLNSNMVVPRGATAGAFIKSTRQVVIVGGSSELRLDSAKDIPFDITADTGLASFEVFDLESNSFITDLVDDNGVAKRMSMKRVFPRLAVMQDDTVHVYGGGPLPAEQTGSGGALGYDVVDIYISGNTGAVAGAFKNPTPALESIEDRSGLSVSLIEVTEDNLSRFLLWGGSRGNLLGEVYNATSLEKDQIQGAFKRVEAVGDVPAMTLFHEMTRLGNRRFLLSGGMRDDGTVAADDAYVVTLENMDAEKIIANCKRVPGFEVGRFMHAAVATDSTHAVVFGGFTDRAFTPTGDKRIFAMLADDAGTATLTLPGGEADFAPMGAVTAVPLESDAVLLLDGVADFASELQLNSPLLQQVRVYAPSTLWNEANAQ